jgi:hypothetical protein
MIPWHRPCLYHCSYPQTAVAFCCLVITPFVRRRGHDPAAHHRGRTVTVTITNPVTSSDRRRGHDPAAHHRGRCLQGRRPMLGRHGRGQVGHSMVSSCLITLPDHRPCRNMHVAVARTSWPRSGGSFMGQLWVKLNPAPCSPMQFISPRRCAFSSLQGHLVDAAHHHWGRPINPIEGRIQ